MILRTGLQYDVAYYPNQGQYKAYRRPKKYTFRRLSIIIILDRVVFRVTLALLLVSN